VEITGDYTAPFLPQSIQFHGGGAFNGDMQQAKLSLSIDASSSTPAFEITEVVDRTDFYLSSPAFAGGLPYGKTWMKLDLSSILDADSTAAGQSDPRQELEMLEQVSDEFIIAGKELVRGHQTTHYSASISSEKVIEQMRANGDDDNADLLQKLNEQTGTTSSPVEVWIDDRNLVRRFKMSIPLPSERGTITGDMTMEFFDFGAKPRIVLPPESQVYDATGDAAKALDDLTS
jgi:hypothetical protein